MDFDWDLKKNKILIEERGVCFEDVVVAINENALLDIIEHPNEDKYPSQKIYIVELNSYIYMVPFVDNQDTIFLKTIIPSRKMNQRYKRNTHE